LLGPRLCAEEVRDLLLNHLCDASSFAHLWHLLSSTSALSDPSLSGSLLSHVSA
jgi:hypothetical protein